MERSSGWTWSLFFARWILGLTFGMAGWWKVFALGADQHAQNFFINGFAETWIPTWLLWSLGYTLPYLELVGGIALCLGWRRRPFLILLGFILLAITYGHLLQEPLYSLKDHIFPRLVLLLFLLSAPEDRDRLSLDRWLKQRRR